MPTYQDIQEKLAKVINYNIIATVLQTDLNSIAQEIITDPKDSMEFKVFFDFGNFDTTVNAQAPGEGQGFLITPVLLSLVNGDYSTQKGPQVYSLSFRIEALGFEKDKDNLQKIFEVYSALNHGQIVNEEDSIYNTMVTTFCDFPVKTEPIPYKGFNRISIFLTLNINFIYNGQLTNEITYTLDGDNIEPLSFTISRNRSIDTVHPNNGGETITINQSQSLIFNGSMIYDGSDAAKSLVLAIKTLNSTLNTIYSLVITYPNILIGDPEAASVDTYNVVLIDGDLILNVGGYLTLNFTFAIAS